MNHEDVLSGLLSIDQKSYSVGTQTLLNGDTNTALCLRCNNNLNSPSRTNSPYIMKLVKSTDSVTSETKSSLSLVSNNGNAILSSPSASRLGSEKRKDDLQVNPILGHHRLCDRTTVKAKSNSTPNGDQELSENDSKISKVSGSDSSAIGSTSASKKTKPNAFDGNKIFENFNRNLINTIKVN